MLYGGVEKLSKLRKVIPMVCFFSILILTACDSQKETPLAPLPSKQNALQPKDVGSSHHLLDKVVEKAKKGMVVDSPFNVLDSTIAQVKAEWGEPDKVDKVGNGNYATFNKQNVVLGFNETGDIFDIRSYSKDLKGATFETIKKTLGQPYQVNQVNNETIYVFQIASNIELKWIIPNATKVVDHIAVVNPQRTNTEVGPSKSDYILDIRGTSNQLTSTAWQSMLNWRKQIALFSKQQENVYINGPNRKMVALTFDDGPDGVITPAIIDILAEKQVKGNFFFLGSEVIKHPDVVKKAYDKGNLVLSHSYNHVDLTKLAKEDIRIEIEKAGATIKTIIGKEPAILRTPYGETNAQVAEISREEGNSIVLWSIDTLDWSQKEAGNIVKNVTDNVRNGDIILMHSDSEKIETKKALPLIIDALQERNFEIVDLGTLLSEKPYH